ncbi:hypothetical protein C0Q70_07476 [Pomacea canaliculata]|uniref:Small EDRK-rich factor-like N-terminal domain-containing protein n=1 Tax=Pomacea canaliculata TaxID=400727 RepID=A0A2T7PF48_POMCA|nr:zinc finger protein 706-like [Pomacea canaliculata]PVD32049.1 hypothetical protein C0Q70_07476 [Pomacea canaliculata]
MARGHQKIQSQARAQKKADSMKKPNNLHEQKKAAQKALVHSCPICRAQMPDPKTFKQHFENKHPKEALPEELKDV